MQTDVFTKNDDFSVNVRFYTYGEVAKILRCSERTVHNRVRNGDIVPLRNGRLVLFTDQCIAKFLKQ
jgi:excisionase family DNA binding protein